MLSLSALAAANLSNMLLSIPTVASMLVVPSHPIDTGAGKMHTTPRTINKQNAIALST